MIWQNPWAWAGLLALALPILIHLFSRRQARVQPFPSLRFLDASRLLPTRRTRVADWLLLLVRLGVLAAATAAMAQPLWLTRARARSRNDALARVIVVDTSLSMRRGSASGDGRALDVARRAARRLADSSTVSMMVETNAPRQQLDGAVAWLREQSGRGEVVIVSDFQPGALDSLDLLTVPHEVGITLAPIGIANTDAASPRAIEVRTPAGDGDLRTRATTTANATQVAWTNVSRTTDSSAREIDILASEAEQQDVRNAERAVKAIGGTLLVDARWPVALVFPGYAGRATLVRDAKPLDSLWMVRIVMRLRANQLLADAAMRASVSHDSNDARMSLALARTRDGEPVALAMGGNVQGKPALLIVARVDAGSMVAAALIDAVTRAANEAAPFAESDPMVRATSELRAWERAPGARIGNAPAGDAQVGDSDARWMWMLVLLLMALETWLRRARSGVERASTVPDAVA